jgi:phosphocarrier protein FPr
MSDAGRRVGLVLVSHSRALAEAARALARQMVGTAIILECAAGVGEGGEELGTDAVAIMQALERVAGPAGAVVLMDLGSAILSAQTALDLVDPDIAARTRLSGGPFVEGAVAAAVRAAAGGSLDEVAAEAARGLMPKAAQLGEPESGALDGENKNPAPAAVLEVVVAGAHGLHARPAARLVARAADFDAAVSLENVTSGRGPVPAGSLTALASLDARRGHVVRLSATGRQATEALEALASILRETERITLPPPAARPGVGRAIPVSRGVALGPLVRLTRVMPRPSEAPVPDPAAEVQRLREAIDRTEKSLGAALGRDDLAAAHRALLQDPAIVDRARAHIEREHRSAAFAWQRAIEEAAAVYRGLDDPYLQARETDVRDVGLAVLRVLLGATPVSLPEGPPAIIVADDLLPSEAAQLDPSRVLGVIDRRGGPTSHASILLRGAGIPAVCAAAAVLPEPPYPDGVEARAGIDGETGEVWLDPDPGTVAALERRKEEISIAFLASRHDMGGAVQLAGGPQVELWANVAGLLDARAAKDAGVFGIGLLRTEFLFLDRIEAPTEQEQAELLSAIFAPFAGAPIVVRTLDAGGDKSLPYLRTEPEANPFLGVRGIRLSLRHMALFEAQLRAILTAAQGHDVRIMIPMVTDAAEIDAARAALERAHVALAAAGRPHPWPVPLGIMVEVPAAALRAAHLAANADFFSIGTNDLTQYTLAAERGHRGLSALADPAHPAVLGLVRVVVEAGRAAQKPVSVCGEAAGDPAVARILVGLGVTKLSMGAAALGPVRASLRAASFQSLVDAAGGAL